MSGDVDLARRRWLAGLALAGTGRAWADGGAAAPPAPWPAAQTLDYQVRRGMLSGTGRLSWQPSGERYVLKLEARVPLLGTVITQTSTGRLGPNGLVPDRFTDERLRREPRVADFQRPDGPIRFSGRTQTAALQPGMQDRLSWMVQLACLVQRDARLREAGRELELVVVGARGDVDTWPFRARGEQPLRLADGRMTRARHFERLPQDAHGSRAEVWLDPSHHHLPARARLSDGKDAPFDLILMAP